jgi:hypothetical protein
MKNYFKYIFILTLAISQISCNEDGFEDLDLDISPVSSLSGDWIVKTFIGNNLVLDDEIITTSNSNEDDGTKLSIFDHEHINSFNIATNVDINAMTFSGTDLPSNVDGKIITVTVTNGVITKGGTTSPRGRISDLISFAVEFSAALGTTYPITGFKRTGFLEDEP